MFHCKPSIWGYPYLWKPPFHLQEKLEEVTLYYHNFNIHQVQGHVMTWMWQQGMRKILETQIGTTLLQWFARSCQPLQWDFEPWDFEGLRISQIYIENCATLCNHFEKRWPASNKAHSFLWNWNPQSPSTFPKGSCIGSWQSEHRAWSNRRRHHPASTAHPSDSSWLITQSDFI